MKKGFGSQVLALSKEAGVPLAPTQAQLTPLQRNILLLQLKEQQDKIEEKKSGRGASRPRNSLRKPGGGGRGQTTTYKNEKYQ